MTRCTVVFIGDQQVCLDCDACWDAHDWDGLCRLDDQPVRWDGSLDAPRRAAHQRGRFVLAGVLVVGVLLLLVLLA